VAVVVKPGPSPCPIIRIDTNQGVYGLGEVRDGALWSIELKWLAGAGVARSCALNLAGAASLHSTAVSTHQ
jgi:hypothetical protein